MRRKQTLKSILRKELLSHRKYRDVRFAFCFFLEAYRTVHQCEQCMVFADPDVHARIVDRTALAYDDITCLSHLTSEEFHTKTFAF